jgi:ribonuclease BN (tRNA processing enzyme)
VSERLVILGSKGGPAIRPGGPSPTASLLEIGGRRIVIDCGLGVARGLVEAGMALPALDLVLITHLHSDHVLELGPLLHTAWTAGLKTPVQIFGPVGTRAVWDGFVASLAYDINLRIDDEGRPDIRKLVQIEEFGEGELLDENGLTIEALRVDTRQWSNASPSRSVTRAEQSCFPPTPPISRRWPGLQLGPTYSCMKRCIPMALIGWWRAPEMATG